MLLVADQCAEGVLGHAGAEACLPVSAAEGEEDVGVFGRRVVRRELRRFHPGYQDSAGCVGECRGAVAEGAGRPVALVLRKGVAGRAVRESGNGQWEGMGMLGGGEGMVAGVVKFVESGHLLGKVLAEGGDHGHGRGCQLVDVGLVCEEVGQGGCSVVG